MQIVTNLASNACKFTPPGGQLRVATKLIVPTNVWTPFSESEKEKCGNGVLSVDSSTVDEYGEKVENGERREEGQLSATSLSMHNLRHSKPPELVVVRIEVQDTGYGIPLKEMEQSKLFCTSLPRIHFAFQTYITSQLRSTKRNRASNKVARAPVLALRSFARSSNARAVDWV